MNKLKKMPLMYPVYEDIPVFRKLTIEDYIAFYKVDDAAGVALVHRLIYARMDLPAQLKKRVEAI